MTTSPTQPLADRLLLYLRRQTDAVPVVSLLKRFHIDDDALNSALKEITGWGYRVKKMRGIVKYVEAPDFLTSTEIQFGLKSKRIGRAAHCYRSVKSTNDLAAQMAEQGAPEGTIVTAEQQTQGRGRLGRTWHSPEGSGIYLSIILRPRFTPDKAPGLSLMTALALADTLSSRCPGEVRIKWPNDVLLSGRKVAGILTELSAERGKINHVLVGVGVNVNQKADDFPDELRSIATSLRRITKKPTNRAELLREFLYRFEQEYAKYIKSGLQPSRKRLKNYSALLGYQVRLLSASQELEGKAVDIDPDGALVLEYGGSRFRISAGEVSVVKN
jgi:BirA family biotin operon repressor/biotin-[acetyl-CoA-carboxylase] ligase